MSWTRRLQPAARRAGQTLNRWRLNVADRDGVILMGHSVPDPAAQRRRLIPTPNLERSPAELIAAIDHYDAQGYTFISLDELTRRLATPGPRRGRRFVCLTFDDGYKDNFTNAYPLLQRRQIPFTVFVIPAFIDKALVHYGAILQDWALRAPELRFTLAGRRYALPSRTRDQKLAALRRLQALCAEHLLPLDYRAFFEDQQVPIQDLSMSWDELTRLASDPLVTIGAHTLHHARLPTLDEAQARDEIVGGKDRLEDALGRPVEHFAYPFGAHGQRDAQLARDAGFRTLHTTRQDIVKLGRTSPWSLPRLRL